MPPLICTDAHPCWILGLGYRPVVETETACAIEDTPMEAKIPPGVYALDRPFDPFSGSPSADIIAPASGPMVPSGPDAPGLPCCIWTVPDTPMPPLAPVSLQASLDFMGAAILTLFIVHKLDQWVKGAEKVRGAKLSGWNG